MVILDSAIENKNYQQISCNWSCY